jgi:hypothetical protein
MDNHTPAEWSMMIALLIIAVGKSVDIYLRVRARKLRKKQRQLAQ